MQMIKRTLSILLTVVMLVSMFSMVTVASAAWDGSVATDFASGSGTEADPYIIMNASQLAYYVSGNGTSSYVKLGADIVINENVLSEDYTLNAGSFIEWPVNSTTLSGSGVFDGDGHTIYGFYATANKAGLFYCIEGTVKNLTIADSYVGTFNATHGILGYKTNGGTIENVVVDGLAGGNHNGSEYGRGLMFGSGLGTFTNCITRGKVTAGVQNESAQKAGPFIGSASSGTSFTNCVNYADVDNLTQTGGFVGYTGGSLTFTDCINYGNISTRQKYNSWEGPTHQRHGSASGGFVGVTYGGSITFTRCANEGTINGDAYSGGFVGVVLQRYTPTITINNSYNLGAVSCQATNGIDYHGDFIGHVYAGNQVTDTNLGAGNLAIYQAGGWLGEEADLWVVKSGTNPTLKLVAGDEPEAPHEHAYTAETTDATCTEAGKTVYTCECGDTYEEVIDALGHTEATETVDATCTVDGSTIVKCSVCGETISATVIPATGHTYVDGKCECGDVDPDAIAQVGDKYFYSFADAYAAAEAGDTITLLADITASAIITIDKPITLDGNGKTLTSTAGRAINVDCTGDVTIEDLTIVAKGERAINIINQPATVTINNVTATAGNYAVNLATSAGAANVTINDSDLTGLAVVNVASAGAYVEINDTKLTNVDANPNENYGAITVYHAAENATVNVNGGEIIVADDSRKAYVFADSATVNGIDDVGMIAARIGDAGYETFEEALADAKVGDTITVIQTAVIDEDMTIANVKIVAGSKADPAIRIVNGATVTFENVTIDAAEYCVILGASDFSSAGNLIIKSGSYHGNITAISVTKGNLVIEGGSFSADPYNGNYAYLINCIDSSYRNGTATVTISGGTFANWNPQDNAAEGAGSDFCADGFEGVDNGDGTFGVVVHEHDYVAEVIDPTCTEAGKTVYTCRCEDTYEEEIPALGHTEVTETVDATCTEPGSITVTCDVCGETLSTETIDALGHNYVDGTCSNCGEADPDAVVLPELKVKSVSMVLQSNISLNYLVEKSLFADDAYADPYMTFVIRGRESVVTEYTESGSNYVFTLKGIAPNELTQNVTATLYATANGEEYTAVKEFAAADYGYKVLELYAAYPSQAKLLTLIVDLLNYGAQAQIYTNFDTENLANAALTDAEKAFGTSETPTLTSIFNSKYETIDSPTVVWKSKTLILEDAVVMKYIFATDSVEGVTMKFSAAGMEWTKTAEDFVYDSASNTYYVLFNELDAGMMSEAVYITAYKDGVAVSNTVRDSIESYAQMNQ
ncbi:MAG: hypothetical protein IJC04_00290, partial [Oscillospiraceae bacterium]|nr:hypothetical protein [Oscillospiraceae bacterium]